MTQESKKPSKPAKPGSNTQPEKEAVTAKQSRELPPTKPKKTAEQNARPRWVPLLLILLLILIAAAGYAGWQYLYLPIQAMQTENAQQYERIEQSVATNIEALTSNLAQQKLDSNARALALSNDIAAVSEKQLKTIETLEAMQQYQSLNHSDWLLDEAEHLIVIANHSVQLARDTQTALTALRYADSTLHSIDNPALTPVRKALAQEILALASYATLDVTGISLQLESISNLVTTLPLAADQQQEFKLETQTTTTDILTAEPGVSNWLAAAWSDIQNLFSLRKTDAPVVPLIPPEQRFFLTENTRLVLHAMQLSLLRRDQAAFDENLNKAQSWVAMYFDTDSQSTKTVLKNLNDMQSLVMSHDLPDISQSIQALRAYRTRSPFAVENVQ